MTIPAALATPWNELMLLHEQIEYVLNRDIHEPSHVNRYMADWRDRIRGLRKELEDCCESDAAPSTSYADEHRLGVNQLV